MNIYFGKRTLPVSQSGEKTEIQYFLVEPIDYAFLFVFVLLMLQGLFFNQVTLWVVERRYFIFNLLPFNLYPSDLFLLPVLILLAIFSKKRRQHTPNNELTNSLIPLVILVAWGIALLLGRRIGEVDPDQLGALFDFFGLLLLIPLFLIIVKLRQLHDTPIVRRKLLLLLWWIIFFFGTINGFLNQTPNLTGDVRELGLRSLLAIATFYLGLHINLLWISNKIIGVGIVFSLIIGMTSIAELSGITFLPSVGVHAILPLLLPYSLALAKALSGQKNTQSSWIFPFLIALGIMLTVSKPAVGGLILCTLVTVIVIRQRIFSSLGTTILFLILTGFVIVALFGLFDTTADVQQIVQSDYLKQDYAVQDLSGSRFAIWEMGIAAWQKRPIIGYGFGYLLSGETINISTGADVYQKVIWPHNIVVQFLMQTGLLGSVLFGVVMVGWFTQVMRDRNILFGQIKWVHAAFVSIPITIVFMALYGQFFGHVHGGFLLWTCIGLEASIISRACLPAQSSMVKNE